MTNPHEFEQEVAALLEQEFQIDHAIVSATTNIRKDLGLDEYEWNEFIAAVERRFGVSLYSQEESSLVTVADVVNAVARRHA